MTDQTPERTPVEALRAALAECDGADPLTPGKVRSRQDVIVAARAALVWMDGERERLAQAWLKGAAFSQNIEDPGTLIQAITLNNPFRPEDPYD